MAEPKKKMSRSRRGKRRSHQALGPRNLIPCSKCRSLIPPHLVCYNCGYYRGKKIIDVEAKEKKKAESASSDMSKNTAAK